MNYLRKTILISTFCLWCTIGFSQTYITPIVGVELLKVEAYLYTDLRPLSMEKASLFPFIGIMGEHYLLDYLSVAVSVQYNRISFKRKYPGFLINFRLLRISLGINYCFKNFHLGTYYVKDFHFVHETGFFNPVIGGEINRNGLSFTIGYNYDNLYSHIGYTVEFKNNSLEYYQIKPLKSFNFTIGYRIKL